ncbi:MAG: rhodanese-like domain-containing protein [Methanotrichaceae archaeon]
MNSNYIILGAFIGLFVLVALVYGAHAAECTDLIGCDSSNANSGWNGDAKLDEIGNPQAEQSQAPSAKIPELSREKRWNMPGYGFGNETNKTSTNNAPEVAQTSLPTESTPTNAANDNADLQRSEESRRMLASMDDISSSDILVDVSDNSTKHIKGSVVLPYTEFDLDPGIPKSPTEIAQILGNAGISRNDSVVLYGECLPCGGGPSLATYVYWIMKSIGHENIRVLNGTVEDWAAAGRETTNESAIRPSKVYEPKVNPDFSASYDYVKGGSAQIVDARTIPEYGAGNIPGSINIDYDRVLNNRTIKSDSDLKKVFAILSKDRPVVVYTNTGVKASVVWFALEMMGYDAKLYSWQDWLENQPHQAQQGNATNATA